MTTTSIKIRKIKLPPRLGTMKFAGDRKTFNEFIGRPDENIITDHMANDIETENRRQYFKSNRIAGRGMKAWAITATFLFILAIVYNFYLLSVIGDLILKTI